MVLGISKIDLLLMHFFFFFKNEIVIWMDRRKEQRGEAWGFTAVNSSPNLNSFSLLEAAIP